VNNEFTIPAYLQPGARILIVAPAGAFSDRDALDKAIRWIQNNGWEAEVHPQTFISEGSLAGNDSLRIQVLNESFARDDIQAVWAVRGGYGSIRIIEDLNFSLLKQNPKWIIGFSDITHFHLKSVEEKIQSIHGLMPVQFGKKIPEQVLNATSATLRGKLPEFKIKRDSMNLHERDTSGIMTGGNAATLLSYITSCRFDFTGKILFLEDVGEHLYSIDRIFRSLNRHGIFSKINALILGQFTDIKQDTPPFPYSIKQIVRQVTETYDLPVFFNFPAGHVQENFPLVMGAKYKILTDDENWNLIPLKQEIHT